MYGDSDFDGGFLEQASREFNVPKENIAHALNSAQPHEGYVLARQVAQNHKTYLVSNQIKFRTDFIKSSFVLSFFEKLYFSNEIQHLKPHKDFFQYVLADIGVGPEQCIFVDDNGENIQSAKELGFGTIHVVSVEQMKTELDYVGLL
jgi:HAD superfamily hydrolase (TIGR01509 family)